MKNMILVIMFFLIVILSSCMPPLDSFDNPEIVMFELPVTSVFASGDDGNVPTNTLDNNLSTRWSSHGLGEWIIFELNDTYEVQSINVSWYVGDSRVAYFDVFYSEDNNSWIKVYSGESSGTTNDYENHDLLDAAARYVRIVGNGNSGNRWNSITTIAIIGKNTDKDTLYLDYTSEPAPSPITSPNREVMSLRGNPNFDADILSPAQRERYDDLKMQLAHPRDWATDPYRRAAFDDSWWISHHLQTHIMGVLTVFRMTGDLELLDHVNELAELMRSTLHDSWRDTKDGTDGTSDGYLNWVMRMSGGGDHNYGKDTHMAYEQKAHATIAMIAYALDNNSDFTSPKGYNYGANADFWKDYLVNHFEAKWRSRRGTADGSWPIMNWVSDVEKDWPAQRNSFFGWIRWHYYMGLLTNDSSYTAEAMRMSDRLLRGMVLCSTPAGDAYVWHHSDQTHSAAKYAPYLMGVSYAEYIFAFAIDMYFEGFHDWANPIHLQRYGLTMSQYVIGDADIFTEGLHGDVGGDQDRCGVPSRSDSVREALRIDPYLYARTSISWLSYWDKSVLLLSNNMLDYGESRNYDTSRILTGMMLHDYLGDNILEPLTED